MLTKQSFNFVPDRFGPLHFRYAVTNGLVVGGHHFVGNIGRLFFGAAAEKGQDREQTEEAGCAHGLLHLFAFACTLHTEYPIGFATVTLREPARRFSIFPVVGRFQFQFGHQVRRTTLRSCLLRVHNRFAGKGSLCRVPRWFESEP